MSNPMDILKKKKSSVPFMPTWRSYSKSHLFATTMTGKLSWSFTRRICWWNVVISSKEFREVMEYTKRKPSPVLIYCSRIALRIRINTCVQQKMPTREHTHILLALQYRGHREERLPRRLHTASDTNLIDHQCQVYSQLNKTDSQLPSIVGSYSSTK